MLANTGRKKKKKKKRTNKRESKILYTTMYSLTIIPDYIKCVVSDYGQSVNNKCIKFTMQQIKEITLQ